MNLHNVAKVFSYFKSHLNYVDFILLTCQMNPATHHCVAAVRYATLFFLTPTLHIPHVGRDSLLPLSATRANSNNKMLL